MSQQSSPTPGGESGQALLCWSDAPNFPTREEFVQVLESHLSVALIKSALSVAEKTKVTLIGKDYTGIGIVKSCRKEGINFILSIEIGDQPPGTALPSHVDPGALVIDDFLTEEEEAKILEGLGDSTARGFSGPSPLLSSLLFAGSVQ